MDVAWTVHCTLERVQLAHIFTAVHLSSAVIYTEFPISDAYIRLYNPM